MSRVTKTVTVAATPESVIEYIAEVENHPAFIEPLKSVENLTGPATEPGTTWDWTFVMAGIELSGRAEALEYVPGRLYKYRTTTGILSTFTYSVEPEGDGARLVMDVEYEVPGNVVEKVGLAAAEKLNDRAGDGATENLRTILE